MKKLLSGLVTPDAPAKPKKPPVQARLESVGADTYVLHTKAGSWTFSREHYPAVLKRDPSGEETLVRLRPTRPILLLNGDNGSCLHQHFYIFDAVLRTEEFDTMFLFVPSEERPQRLQLEIEEMINDLWAKCDQALLSDRKGNK